MPDQTSHCRPTGNCTDSRARSAGGEHRGCARADRSRSHVWRESASVDQIVLGASGALFSGALFAAGITCPASEIEVTGGNPSDQALACAAIADGLPVLQSLGLGLTGALKIELAKTGPGAQGTHEVGHYDVRDDTIRMLGYEGGRLSKRAKPTELGLHWSPSLWKSYLVQEMAHASVSRRDPKRRVTRGEHEYIAAVAQLSAIPASAREIILKHYADATGFDNPQQINEIYYLMEPGRYAVQSYLHFLKPENGTAFIRGIVPAGSQPGK